MRATAIARILPPRHSEHVLGGADGPHGESALITSPFSKGFGDLTVGPRRAPTSRDATVHAARRATRGASISTQVMLSREGSEWIARSGSPDAGSIELRFRESGK